MHLWLLAITLYASSALSENRTADIDPVKKAAIKELLLITGAQANRDELSRSFTQQMVSVLRANKIPLTPASIEIITKEVQLVVDEQLRDEKLQIKMYRLYARYFTVAEIEGLIAFNRSEVGVKANRVMPVLMRESMNAAQEWSEEIGPVLSDRVRVRLEAHGVKIGR
jgi:hypothetical protein